MIRSLASIGLAAVALAGCATTGSAPPTEVVRYHLGDQIDRGIVAVQPLQAGAPNLEFQSYAGTVETELARVGYTQASAGSLPDFIALVDFHAVPQVGPPHRSPVSIGIGGGGYSGGGYRGGGGVGLGGGVSFPVGHGRRDAVLVSNLSVTIKRRSDQTALWEGKAQGVVDARKPDATAPVQAQRLAAAVFSGFPGESGRTIEVK